MGVVKKTLSLHRAYFSDGYNRNLEDVLNSLFETKNDINNRIYQDDLFNVILFATLEKRNGMPGAFVRILKLEDGAIGVINLDATGANSIVEEFYHPDKRSFLKDEILLYIVGNHIVACNFKNSVSVISYAICKFGISCELLPENFNLRIADVPNKFKIEEIREIGVKKIDLNITSYLASLERSHLKKSWGEVFKNIFGMPDDEKGIRKRANAIGRIVLSRGKFNADEINKDEWLTSIGVGIIEDQETEGYCILLESGVKINSNNIKVNKVVSLKKHANSFSYEQALLNLRKYYQEILGGELLME